MVLYRTVTLPSKCGEFFMAIIMMWVLALIGIKIIAYNFFGVSLYDTFIITTDDMILAGLLIILLYFILFLFVSGWDYYTAPAVPRYARIVEVDERTEEKLRQKGMQLFHEDTHEEEVV